MGVIDSQEARRRHRNNSHTRPKHPMGRGIPPAWQPQVLAGPQRFFTEQEPLGHFCWASQVGEAAETNSPKSRHSGRSRQDSPALQSLSELHSSRALHTSNPPARWPKVFFSEPGGQTSGLLGTASAYTAPAAPTANHDTHTTKSVAVLFGSVADSRADRPLLPLF